VGDGRAVGQRAAAAGQGAWLLAHRAQSAAGRAGVLAGQGAGLLLQQGAEGALGQAAGGRVGDLLQGGEIDVQASESSIFI
jgi:hypothetical protein